MRARNRYLWKHGHAMGKAQDARIRKDRALAACWLQIAANWRWMLQHFNFDNEGNMTYEDEQNTDDGSNPGTSEGGPETVRPDPA